jgi:hypothetical protein
MHTDKQGFEKILSKYSKVVDPGMLEGTVQYAYDFVEKIPLVKREAFQVTLDLVGEKRPAAKTGSANSVLRQKLGGGARQGRFFQITVGKGSSIASGSVNRSALESSFRPEQLAAVDIHKNLDSGRRRIDRDASPQVV